MNKHNSNADMMTAWQTPSGMLPLDVAASRVLEPGTRVILMCLVSGGGMAVVPCVEWARVVRRHPNPAWTDVKFRRFGEERTETWSTDQLRLDRR